ncbi:MAG: penicillin-binding protein 2 [Candidatus Omnitrophica bacterium]|nr:penicillin-binding protein 2 [Candidatus Omnitrophota bacterium]
MRNRIFTRVILFFFAVLTLGLFYTQVLQRDVYEKLSEKNRVRVLPLEAPRGKIYDRKGRLLVNNRISFDVEVIFQEIKDVEGVIDLLSDIAYVDRQVLSLRIEKARRRPFIPVKIIEDIEKHKAIQIEEIALEVPGVIVTTRPLRNYIYKNSLSRITGYLGKISEEELDKYRTYGYRMRDFVGKDGIERSYNDYLRGVDGGLQVEVDSRGRELCILAIKEPQSGRDLHLSIDIELQKFCDSLLAEKRGAIVAMDPQTGAILAITSHPDFDPNIFVKRNNSKNVTALLNNSTTYPMLNRAISGLYPPGSVFKIIIASAALNEGCFDNKRTLTCEGSIMVGNRRFRCWREKGHGVISINEGIKASCNVFFYQLGILVGPDGISRYAFRFGFGKPTGIDIPGEANGFVPTPAWKRKNLRQPWFKGETANYAIGQGYLLVTPIQVVRAVAAIANGGKLVHPFVVERIEDVRLQHAGPRSMGLKKETLTIVKEALRDVVNARRGTGLYARSKDTVISGKTGTAQNPKGTSHAWFTGFAPFENPRLSIVVFIEHGGKGGLDPARFAKNIIEEAKRLELL